MFHYKKIILSSIIVVLLTSCWIEKKPDVLWIHVSTWSYKAKEWYIETVNEKKLTTKEQKKIDDWMIEIWSYVTTFCAAYDDVNTFIRSHHFDQLKKKINQYDDNKWELSYIFLPKIINESCNWRDNNYLETLILYLQSDESEYSNYESKLNNKQLEEYIESLSLTDDAPKNIKDKEVFNKYFLEDKKDVLEAFYYPYYVKEKWNIWSFLAKPIFSLEKDNSFKEKALRNLINQTNDLGFETFDEFKLSMLQNNWYNNEKEIKDSLIEDYNFIISQDSTLEETLNDLNQFKSYLNSRNHESLLTNTVINDRLSLLWKKMLILSMTSSDYADWLNETWSWKEFFWDQNIWNSIIRLNFIYILTL